MMTTWLKNCEICNTGLCSHLDELKAKGMSEREAARKMSVESDGIYSEEHIRKRYRYHTGRDKKLGEILPSKALPTDEDARDILRQFMIARKWHLSEHLSEDDVLQMVSKNTGRSVGTLREWNEEREAEEERAAQEKEEKAEARRKRSQEAAMESG
jgi:hypothetical protein